MNIITRSFEFNTGNASLLNNEDICRNLLNELVKIAKLTPLEYTCHRFDPQGLSATIILSESHIAIHTWPEHGSGYIVLTSCASQDSIFNDTAVELINQAFEANTIVKELA